MTAVEQLLASIEKHMARNRQRRGGYSQLKMWEREIDALANAARAEVTRGITIDIGPVLKGSNQWNLADKIAEAVAKATEEQDAQ